MPYGTLGENKSNIIFFEIDFNIKFSLLHLLQLVSDLKVLLYFFIFMGANQKNIECFFVDPSILSIIYAMGMVKVNCSLPLPSELVLNNSHNPSFLK